MEGCICGGHLGLGGGVFFGKKCGGAGQGTGVYLCCQIPTTVRGMKPLHTISIYDILK